MKKIFKVLLIIIGIVALLGGGFATFISIRGIPSFEVKAPNIKVAITPEKIKRGKQLATVLCVRCHMGKSSGTLTGNYLDDAPEQFGKIYSRNITQHKEKGIGDWTDGELTYLF
ncbi:MAG: cytochrome c, partial [Bacteroidetes bacterium]|nr:cytochrome c [Bacteroidota bacterium]